MRRAGRGKFLPLGVRLLEYGSVMANGFRDAGTLSSPRADTALQAFTAVAARGSMGSG